MDKKSTCENCVYFTNDSGRPFCKAFGLFVKKEHIKKERGCAAFAEKKEKKIKQFSLDEMEDEKCD